MRIHKSVPTLAFKIWNKEKCHTKTIENMENRYNLVHN